MTGPHIRSIGVIDFVAVIVDHSGPSERRISVLVQNLCRTFRSISLCIFRVMESEELNERVIGTSRRCLV